MSLECNIENYIKTLEQLSDEDVTKTEIVNDIKRIIKNNKRKETTEEQVNEFFDRIWLYYPNRKNKNGVKLTRRRKLYREGFYRLTQAIDAYKKDTTLKINGGFVEMMYGSTFFNGRYEDYLPPKTSELLKEIKTESSQEERILL